MTVQIIDDSGNTIWTLSTTNGQMQGFTGTDLPFKEITSSLETALEQAHAQSRIFNDVY